MKIILLAAKLESDHGPSEEAEGAAGGGDGGGNDLNKLRDAVPLYPDLEAALGTMEPMPGSSSSSWTTEEEIEDVDNLTMPPTTPSSPSKGNGGDGEDDKDEKKEEGAGKDDDDDEEEKKKKEVEPKKKTTGTTTDYSYSFYGGGSSYSSGGSSRSSGGSYWFVMYCIMLCTWSVGRHHRSFEVGQNTRLECGFGGWSCDDVCQNMDENMLGCCLTLSKNGTVPANMTSTTGNASTTTTKAPSSIILKALKKVTTPKPPASKSADDKKLFCHCCRVEGIQRLNYKGYTTGRGPITNRDKLKMPKMCGGCKLVEISNIRLQLHVNPEELERRRQYKALMA